MGTTGSTPANTPVGGKAAGSGKTRRPNPPPIKHHHSPASSSPAPKKSPKNYVEIEGAEEEGGEQLESGKLRPVT